MYTSRHNRLTRRSRVRRQMKMSVHFNSNNRAITIKTRVVKRLQFNIILYIFFYILISYYTIHKI